MGFVSFGGRVCRPTGDPRTANWIEERESDLDRSDSDSGGRLGFVSFVGRIGVDGARRSIRLPANSIEDVLGDLDKGDSGSAGAWVRFSRWR